jgi:hypothetical protein
MTMVSVSEETEQAISALKANAPIWVNEALQRVLDEAHRIATETGWAGQSSRTYADSMSETFAQMKTGAETGLDQLADNAERATAAIRDAGGNY